MAFSKGHDKHGGRKKGTLNMNTLEMRERIRMLIDHKWDSVSNDVDSLDQRQITKEKTMIERRKINLKQFLNL